MRAPHSSTQGGVARSHPPEGVGLPPQVWEGCPHSPLGQAGVVHTWNGCVFTPLKWKGAHSTHQSRVPAPFPPPSNQTVYPGSDLGMSHGVEQTKRQCAKHRGAGYGATEAAALWGTADTASLPFLLPLKGRYTQQGGGKGWRAGWHEAGGATTRGASPVNRPNTTSRGCA